VLPAAAPAVPAAPAPAGTRLAISAGPGVIGEGQAVTVRATLTRRPQGTPLAGREVRVYRQRTDSDAWVLLVRLRTDRAGKATYRYKPTGDSQFTLRFPGSGADAAAASHTLNVDMRPVADQLDARLSAAVARARADARRAGLDLTVNSGFRTWTKQQRMFDDAVRRYGSAQKARVWVLPPQESTHVRGLAVDIGPPAVASWLAERSARYGLCRAYGNEAWHFEYRPGWIDRNHGRCPAPVARPGDPGPYSPAPRVRAY
jgi:hypothetical protein